MLQMLPRVIQPHEISIKRGSIIRLKFLSGSRAAVICGHNSLKAGGYLTKIQSLLEEAKLDVKIVSGIGNGLRVNQVEQVAEILATYQPDLIIACGGGAVIDCAKLARVLAERPDFKIADITKPFSITPFESQSQVIAIPTTSGTGSEVSSTSIVTDEYLHKKIPIVSHELMPDTVILDPTLTVNLPPAVTAYSALDAFTHAFESFCSKISNPYTDNYAAMAGRLIFNNLPLAINQPDELGAREKLQYAAMLAGTAQNVASVGAVHALSHSVEAETGLPHGLGCALFLPMIAMLNAETSLKPTQFAIEIGLASTEELGYWVSKTLDSAGLPLNWGNESANVKRVDIAAVTQRTLEDICLRTNPRKITSEELTLVLEKTR